MTATIEPEPTKAEQEAEALRMLVLSLARSGVPYGIVAEKAGVPLAEVERLVSEHR